MLQYSRKPEVLRSHSLEEKERNKFVNEFMLSLSQVLPNFLNAKLRSSLLLMKALSLLPDIYYSLTTINFCKRRLGEEYTYVAMYKKQHYQEEGLLLNKKFRTLLFVLEIASRNFAKPLFSSLLETQAVFDEKQEKGRLPQNLKSGLKVVRQFISNYFGTVQNIAGNIEYFILMIYMLDWNKHFTFVETLLGIRYAYTFKNDTIKEVSYAIEGYLLLATFAVKAIKLVMEFLRKRKSQPENAKERAFSKRKNSVKATDSSSEGNESEGEKTLCRICYDSIKDKSSTKCGHIFCWDCIIQTLEISSECPICKNACKPREVVQLRNY